MKSYWLNELHGSNISSLKITLQFLKGSQFCTQSVLHTGAICHFHRTYLHCLCFLSQDSAHRHSGEPYALSVSHVKYCLSFWLFFFKLMSETVIS